MSDDSKQPKCNKCGADISFVLTEKGSWLPVSKGVYPIAVEWHEENKQLLHKGSAKDTRVVHFDVCPNAEKREKPVSGQKKDPNSEMEEIPF